MKIYEKSGREVRPNIHVGRPSDDSEPLARPSPHCGIFREVSDIPWAHAQVGSSFITNDGSSVLVLVAKENYDGARWDRLSLALAPVNWRVIEASRVAAQKAASEAAAARETDRLATEKEEAALRAKIRRLLVEAGLPITRSARTGGGWVEDDIGYASGPSSEWVEERTETVDIATEIARSGRPVSVVIAEMMAQAAVDRAGEAARLAAEVATARAAAAVARDEARRWRIEARPEIRRALAQSRVLRQVVTHASDHNGWFNAAHHEALIRRILRKEVTQWLADEVATKAREEAARADAWAKKNPRRADRQAAQSVTSFTGQKLVNNPFAKLSLP